MTMLVVASLSFVATHSLTRPVSGLAVRLLEGAGVHDRRL